MIYIKWSGNQPKEALIKMYGLIKAWNKAFSTDEDLKKHLEKTTEQKDESVTDMNLFWKSTEDIIDRIKKLQEMSLDNFLYDEVNSLINDYNLASSLELNGHGGCDGESYKKLAEVLRTLAGNRFQNILENKIKQKAQKCTVKEKTETDKGEKESE